MSCDDDNKPVLREHHDWVTSLILNEENPESQWLYSSSRDGTVCIWTITDSIERIKLVHKISGHSDYVHSISCNKEGNLILTSSWDKTVKLWSFSEHYFEHKKTFSMDFEVYNAVFLPTEEEIIIGGNRNRVYIVNIASGEIKQTIQTNGINTKIHILQNSAILSSLKGEIKLLKILGSDVKEEYTNDMGLEIVSTRFSPDVSLYTVTGDFGVKFVEASNHRELISIPRESFNNFTLYDTKFSPSHYWSISACSEGVLVINIETKIVTHLRIKDCYAVAMRLDGCIYAGLGDGSIKVFTLTEYEEEKEEVTPETAEVWSSTESWDDSPSSEWI